MLIIWPFNCLFDMIALVVCFERSWWKNRKILEIRTKVIKKHLKIAKKEGIPWFDQFLLIPQYFQKSSAADESKCPCKWLMERFTCQTYNRMIWDEQGHKRFDWHCNIDCLVFYATFKKNSVTSRRFLG